jgi:hypothetical protein
MRAATIQESSLAQLSQYLILCLSVRNAFSSLNLRVCPVDIFEQLQTLLHPLVFMHSNQNIDPTAALGEDYGAVSLVDLFYKGGYSRLKSESGRISSSTLNLVIALQPYA